MNKKENRMLEDKLLELVDNNIITSEQYHNAKQYFEDRQDQSVVTIFGAMGVFLIALSIITIFAINWSVLPTAIKAIIAFVPIIITCVMLGFYIKNGNKSLKLYTSIFAPISIIATNSLVGQIFHIQMEIFEMFFISLMMFLPITFILKNYISIVVYGIGSIIYTIGNLATESGLFYVFVVAMPLVIYNIVNYLKNKEEHLNLVMWVINIAIASLILFMKEIFRIDVLLVHIYMIYAATQTLFKHEQYALKHISSLFTIYLLFSCISPVFVSFAKEIEFGYDTLFLTVLTAGFIYLSKLYKEPKQYFSFIFILLMQYTQMHQDTLFVFVNLLAAAFGVYRIYIGSKENSYYETKRGIQIILILVFLRFVSADLSFTLKSIIFLLSGICFMIGSKKMKNRFEGERDE